MMKKEVKKDFFVIRSNFKDKSRTNLVIFFENRGLFRVYDYNGIRLIYGFRIVKNLKDKK
jgi:hypothetical protein